MKDMMPMPKKMKRGKKRNASGMPPLRRHQDAMQRERIKFVVGLHKQGKRGM